MHDPLSSFLNAIRATGLEPPNTIIPGKFHRFPGLGKCRSNTAGWCQLYSDGRGGVFGDWSTGLSSSWRCNSVNQSNNIEYLERARNAKRVAEIERNEDHDKAAQKAIWILQRSIPVINHEYLMKKRISANGARLDEYNNLIIPVNNYAKTTSLQFISPNGDKRFLSGGKVRGGGFLIGKETNIVLLCEGFATACTLHEMSGYCTVCAFNSGNLLEVAKKICRNHGGELIICGDNDHATLGNPGRTAAIEAARITGAKWIIPDFSGLNAGPKDTDFNDLAQLTSEQVTT